jgi:S1-C subfamily serine protease
MLGGVSRIPTPRKFLLKLGEFAHRGRLAAALAAAALAMSGAGEATRPPLPSQERPLPADLLADERNTIEVFRRVARSVVFITNATLRRDFFTSNVFEVPRDTGSGFVWDARGHIVTNFHVVEGGNRISVTLADGQSYPAKLVGIEPAKDIAVIRIEAPAGTLVPIVPGDSSDLVVGQKVLAIGNPFGYDQTLTTGVISALGREIPTGSGLVIEDVIQTDAPINPGNSGGPLIDSAGRVIGINTAIASPTGSNAGIGFAVPMAHVRRIVPQLIEFGEVKRAGLGIHVLPEHLSRQWRVPGLIVRRVAPGGPAEQAGLRGIEVDARGRVLAFDAIVAIDDREIESYSDLFSALDAHEPGDEVRVRYLREGEERTVKVRLKLLE